MPGPPHAPKTFCAPCAATTRPTTTRTSANATSVEMTGVTKVIDDPSLHSFRCGRTRAIRRLFPAERSVVSLRYLVAKGVSPLLFHPRPRVRASEYLLPRLNRLRNQRKFRAFHVCVGLSNLFS